MSDLMDLELKSQAQKSLMGKLSLIAAGLALLFILPNPVQAQWKLTKLSGPGSVQSSGALHPATKCSKTNCYRSKQRPFYNEGKPAPNGLPDGKIAVSRWFNTIKQAWYILPTKRYDHGILGDAIEAGGLVVKTAKGKLLTYILPKSQVFEDRTPRLTDLDGDGKAEIITILSSTRKGASIAVFGIRDSKLVKTTQTPFIGRTYRWLNIAGIADFNGDGRLDIAGVWTPHIGGTLKFWSLNENSLTQIGSMRGFSNHFIGSREQRLSAISHVDDNGTLDLILPSAGRNAIRMIGFVNGKLKELASLNMPHQIDKAIAVTGKGKKSIFTVGLSDGSTHAVYR
jgi:hypothetical protein